MKKTSYTYIEDHSPKRFSTYLQSPDQNIHTADS